MKISSFLSKTRREDKDFFYSEIKEWENCFSLKVFFHGSKIGIQIHIFKGNLAASLTSHIISRLLSPNTLSVKNSRFKEKSA